MLSLYEILKASKTGIAPDMWTALAGMNWGGADSGHEIKELTGIPPLSFTADGTPLLDYLISGNMSQTGTPTSSDPIQPQETGERTGNLFDENYESISSRLTYTPIYLGDGQFTLSSNIPFTGGTANIFFLAGNVSSGASTVTNGVYDGQSRTVSSVEGYVTIAYRNQATDPRLYKTMLNTGSQPLPYEPYGYKIPISSANTTTPVYLGEVETTRKVKKLVLTGEEFWQLWNGNYYSSVIDRKAAIDTIVCSHFINSSGGITYSHLSSSGLRIAAAVVPFATSVSELKAWLAAQYTAGTPVTVWYVLATEQTGIVNEPLRKIGDYADTVSYEQAGVQILTNKGNTVIDVMTELKPSEIYIKYQE